MKRLFSQAVLTCAPFLLLCLTAATAKADVVIVAGNIPQAGDAAVVLPPADTTGNPLFGSVTGAQVRFGSTDTLTIQNSSLLGRVLTGANGDLRNLATSVVNGSFTSLIFNIVAASNSVANFVLTDINGVATTAAFNLLAAGDNFFTVTTTGGSRIQSVAFTVTQNGVVSFSVDDVNQIRIGGVQVNQVTAVPEPASMILLGTGLASAALARRRIKR